MIWIRVVAFGCCSHKLCWPPSSTTYATYELSSDIAARITLPLVVNLRIELTVPGTDDLNKLDLIATHAVTMRVVNNRPHATSRPRVRPHGKCDLTIFAGN